MTPMTDAELEALEKLADMPIGLTPEIYSNHFASLRGSVPRLVAEVRALRKGLERVLKNVVVIDNGYTKCEACGRTGHMEDAPAHFADCVVPAARALLPPADREDGT